MQQKYKYIDKNNNIIYILIVLLFTLTTIVFLSLNLSSTTLKQNARTYKVNQNKSDFIITPDFNQLDKIINSISFYHFDQYEEIYKDTPLALDYDNINNLENNQYLTPEESSFIRNHIDQEFISRIKNSNRPSIVIHDPIRDIIYHSLSDSFNEIYRNKIADEQAKKYTKILLLLTLNQTNYMNFIEYSLDQQLLAKNENNKYLSSTIASQYDLTIEKKVVKKIDTQLNKNRVHLFLIKNPASFNKPYIIESIDNQQELQLDENEIAIFQSFAKAHQLELGDTLTIGQVSYKITAFVSSPDAIYPILNPTQFYYKKERDTYVLMNDEAFKSYSINHYQSIQYSAKFNTQPQNLDQAIQTLEQQLKNNNILLLPRYTLSDQVFNINLNNLSILSYGLSSIILLISLLFIVIVLNRKINQEQKEIGLLKAMGYHNKEIMNPYLKHYVFLVVIGIFCGLILGFIGSKIITSYLYSIFLIPYKKITIQPMTIIGLMTPIIMTILTTYFVLNKKLKEKPITLLKENSTKMTKTLTVKNYQIILFILMLSGSFLIWIMLANSVLLYITLAFITCYFIYLYSIKRNKKDFIYKVSRRLEQRNRKKIFSFSLTIFISSFLLLFIINIKTIYQDVYHTTKEIHQYDHFIAYPNFLNLTLDDLNGCPEEKCEGFATYTFKLTKINHQQIIDEEIPISGYSHEKPMLKVIDPQLLKDNHIIITKTVADKYKLNTDDAISIKTEYGEQVLRIASIVDNPSGYMTYAELGNLNKWYYGDENHSKHINMLHTIGRLETLFPSESPFLSNIILSYNTTDIFNQISHLFYSFNLIGSFSIILISILSICIILLIMELTLKENTSQITLLKAYGYQNNEIKKMILSQYSPYVMIIFFLTLPITFLISQLIFNFLGINMKMSLMLKLHPLYIFLCLILIIVLYQLVAYVSLFRIKRTSLSSLLKS